VQRDILTFFFAAYLWLPQTSDKDQLSLAISVRTLFFLPQFATQHNLKSAQIPHGMTSFSFYFLKVT